MMENFDESTKDFDLDFVDSGLNMDYFINYSILQCLSVLNKDVPLAEKFTTYRIVVENLQSLVKSRKLLAPDYDTKIKDFQQSPDYLNADNITQTALLSVKKFELITENINRRQSINLQLKV